MVNPVLQALVLADHIYVDADTGKKIIAGTFNAIFAKETPTVVSGQSYAYVCLTDFVGQLELEIRYVDLDTNEVLMKTTGLRADSSDPLRSVEMVVEVPPFPLPHPGVYALEVLCEGAILGSLRINVTTNTDELPRRDEP